MESVGIALALLFGLVAAPVFCLLLVKVIRPLPVLAGFAFWAGVVLLGFFALEVLLVATRGVIGARELVGPGFFPLHVLLTVGVAPALAAVLLLGRYSVARFWPLAAAICWLVGAGAVSYQYAVAETLYGVDGIGGPYDARL